MRRIIRTLEALTLLFVCTAICLPALAAKKKPPAHPIDLNMATIEQLEQLPGIGPVTAKKIIEFREKSGPFRRVEDLLAIPRITKARLEKLRPYVIVKPGKPAKTAAPLKTPGAKS
ncbi:MAG TPA: helix-hairpin-helix domain-containing protein [Candidatus Acidoferrales bacterium]|nr:helix-hairpin-helix domain-containing protein [Candidatus Acidoferrales bacterium]